MPQIVECRGDRRSVQATQFPGNGRRERPCDTRGVESAVMEAAGACCCDPAADLKPQDVGDKEGSTVGMLLLGNGESRCQHRRRRMVDRADVCLVEVQAVHDDTPRGHVPRDTRRSERGDGAPYLQHDDQEQKSGRHEALDLTALRAPRESRTDVEALDVTAERLRHLQDAFTAAGRPGPYDHGPLRASRRCREAAPGVPGRSAGAPSAGARTAPRPGGRPVSAPDAAARTDDARSPLHRVGPTESIEPPPT